LTIRHYWPGCLKHWLCLSRRTNGFVAFGGGLHVRGICAAPAWHSLARFWSGDDALLRIYTSIQPDDVPFGEDALGDQFFLRGADCWRLLAEVDDVEALGCGFDEFISRALADPVEFLGLEPLIQFRREGGTLKPGELINAYPPFSTVEAANGVRLGAVPAHEQHYFLAQLVTQLRGKTRCIEIPNWFRVTPQPDSSPGAARVSDLVRLPQDVGPPHGGDSRSVSTLQSFRACQNSNGNRSASVRLG
jgi:hypothetical protein